MNLPKGLPEMDEIKLPGEVYLKCPNCGEDQLLPDEERDGESDWSLNPCDFCAEASIEEED